MMVVEAHAWRLVDVALPVFQFPGRGAAEKVVPVEDDAIARRAGASASSSRRTEWPVAGGRQRLVGEVEAAAEFFEQGVDAVERATRVGRGDHGLAAVRRDGEALGRARHVGERNGPAGRRQAVRDRQALRGIDLREIGGELRGRELLNGMGRARDHDGYLRRAPRRSQKSQKKRSEEVHDDCLPAETGSYHPAQASVARAHHRIVML